MRRPQGLNSTRTQRRSSRGCQCRGYTGDAPPWSRRATGSTRSSMVGGFPIYTANSVLRVPFRVVFMLLSFGLPLQRYSHVQFATFLMQLCLPAVWCGGCRFVCCRWRLGLYSVLPKTSRELDALRLNMLSLFLRLQRAGRPATKKRFAESLTPCD
jgi:hypothetical protein